MKSVVLALCGVLPAPQSVRHGRVSPTQDTAPKSLWLMAERFEKEGQAAAREVTLKQLIEQYPGSRYARRARAALGIADPEEVPLDVMLAEEKTVSDAGKATEVEGWAARCVPVKE